MQNDTAIQLDKRAKQILRALVVRYLQDGTPIGSGTLANSGDIAGSPATVRNVMADLENIGFLVSPHTSAGRIPSARGIRFFVDRLLTVTPPNKKVLRDLHDGLRGDTSTDALRTAAEVISNLTKYAGFVVVPTADTPIIKTLRFVKLSSSRILAVAVTTNGDVINRIFAYPQDISEKDLNAAATAFNRHFSGLQLDNAKSMLQGQLLELHGQIAALLRTLLDKINPPENSVLQVAGEMNLLKQDDLSTDMEKLRELYDVLAGKKELLALIERGSEAENVRVFIGSECGVQALNECSVVLSSCGKSENGEKPLGIIGVIGPKRMRYNHVIPTVDVAARLLGSVLSNLRLSN